VANTITKESGPVAAIDSQMIRALPTRRASQAPLAAPASEPSAPRLSTAPKTKGLACRVRTT